jgi:hypothetical protein
MSAPAVLHLANKAWFRDDLKMVDFWCLLLVA